MILYQITLHSLPEFVFACRVDLENYKNRFPSIENLLELSVCEAGEIRYTYADGQREIVYPGMLMPITKDMVCTTEMVRPGRQKHITVGVTAEYTCRRLDTADLPDREALMQTLQQGHTFLIPYHWDLEERYDSVVQRLDRIIQNAFSQQGAKRLRAVADWYGLCGELCEFVLEKLEDSHEDLSPYAIRYVEQAQAYIHLHYQKPLRVGQIAEQLGISVGYLHGVFRQVCRCGITEYINEYRIRMAMQHIRGRGMRLKDAAAMVGIEDAAYMSRIFKQKTGMSYREFLAANGRRYAEGEREEDRKEKEK